MNTFNSAAYVELNEVFSHCICEKLMMKIPEKLEKINKIKTAATLPHSPISLTCFLYVMTSNGLLMHRLIMIVGITHRSQRVDHVFKDE